MGGGTSKMVAAPLTPILSTPGFDWGKVSMTGQDMINYQGQVTASIKEATAATAKKLNETSSGWMKTLIIVVVVLVFIFGGLLAYDAAAIKFGWPTVLLPAPPATAPPSTSKVLIIDSAMYGAGSPVDVSGVIRSMVQNDTTLPAFMLTPTALGLSVEPNPGTPNSLTVTYYVGYGNNPSTVTVVEGNQFPALPQANTGKYNVTTPTKSAAPPFINKIFNFLTGSNSSGDLLSTHDTTTATTITANSAPMSAQKEGAYGMQWWMFVKDWNYGYGKDKHIIRRIDPTNPGIMNPQISLHPTDNILRVSLAVYSTHDGGPAPAEHDGSDDVFVCEVPNIPLQAWFSVAVTVFGRNVDIYIDGKLVKSCFTSGVPKPAYGDINVTPDGGFSGKMCGFYHYPRMLTPEDALAFWSSGTPCSTSDTNGASSSATGYSVKFGMYDSLGKEVQEYSF